MKTIGLDVHKRVVQAAILHDDTGEIEEDLRFDCTPEALREFGRGHISPGDRVALESTTNCWAVSAILREFSDQVMVSNPMRTKLIAQSNKKCDRVDALVLAQLLAAGYLPGVWEPDAATRERREISSRRASLVQDRTAVKNRLHSVLAQRLVKYETTKLFSKSGLAFLKATPLDAPGRAMVDSDLRVLEAIEQEIQQIDALLLKLASADEKAKLLMTLPGFDFASAVGILAAAGNITRFPDGNHFASYLGLVPSTRQSAEHTYHGPITKQGRSHARWILCQAAQHVDRHPGPLGHFFRKIAKRKGRNKAVVACARKLAVIAWHLLTNNEPYRYADPRAVDAKLSRLRLRTTGQKRKTSQKGVKRPESYGSGVRTRGIKGIDEVLASEGLPARSAAPAAEMRCIENLGLTQAVATLAAPRRIRRCANDSKDVPRSDQQVVPETKDTKPQTRAD